MKKNDQTIRPFAVIAVCLLLTVVALRWITGGDDDSDAIVFNASQVSSPERPVAVDAGVPDPVEETEETESVSPIEAGENFVPVEIAEASEVTADSSEAANEEPEAFQLPEPEAAPPAFPSTSDSPFEERTPEINVVQWQAFEQSKDNEVVSIPSSLEYSTETIELVDRLESVIEPGTEFVDSSTSRLAALPQKDEKPRFRKFGARQTETDAKEDVSDIDLPTAKKPGVLSASQRWKLAGEPKQGDRYKDDTPLTDSCSLFIEGAEGNFSPTPTMSEMPYDACGEMNVYQCKQLYANQRPLLELGRPWYQLGPISEGSSILGFHNHVNPQYLLFGDARTAFASNRVAGDTNSLIATQLNLVHHLKVTSTERIVAGMTPLSGARSTNYNFDNNETTFEGDANFDFAYFEGDVGAITGGAIGKTLPFDLPFAMGIMPLVFQNGVWMEDEILGFALTIPARNSPRLGISNMDFTFFAGYDRIDSPAFQGDDSAARVMGIASWIEALNGYIEINYAFLDDRNDLDRSYHNMALAYTRRYGRFLSNSTRVIVNAGQQSSVTGTADGVLLLSENSLITGYPSTVVPYLNFFAGFDRPQSVGRNFAAGDILRNTGILFESDNLTGYPTLDATANDTYGMAMGLNLLADEFAQQFIVEAAMLGVMGDDASRNARGDQFGVGVRYQLPLTNSVIFRADAMAGFLRGDQDINGGRMELRKKF